MNEHIEHLGEWYAIRLKNFKELKLDTTREMFKEFKYIISEEGSEDGAVKYHQHIVLVTYDRTLEDIRKIIKDTYPDCNGNKCLYLKPVKDKKQVSKYTLKDGEYYYQGFSDDYINKMFKLSSPKTKLKDRIVKNQDDYIMGEIDFEEFIQEYIMIKADHDQPLYMNHIEAYARKLKVKKEGKRFAQKIAHNIYQKIAEM